MRLRILADAEGEIREAALWYEDHRPGLGGKFLDSVDDIMERIARNPQQFSRYEGKELSRDFRRARLPDFPYLAVFQIRQNEILVVAVAHTSREPGYWNDRE